jgi:hypothetical protein
MHRRSFLGLVAALPLAGHAQRALAAGRAPVFTENGIAIRGADPVAYFHNRGALAGLVTERVRWRGAVWLFATADNREAFEGDPRRFAPRFGGYCALALVEGRLAPSDPRVFAIREGRLYLLSSHAAKKAWLSNVEGNIRQAEERWAAALG